jgi:proteasome assembly chaperone (PAC2) family protein
MRGGRHTIGRVLEVEQWPQLRDPVMLVALTGWVDAGLAGAGSVAIVADQLEAARRFGRVDLSEIADLQQTRPTVELVDGVARRVVWPSIDLVAGRAGRDVVAIVGPEPSIRWRAFADEVVGLAQRLDVSAAVMLGGMPAPVSHRRPVPVLATANARSVAQEIGALRGDYEGPTGAQTVLQVALGDAGIRSIGLWAQVPHYVAGTPSPPAIRALLDRVCELTYLDLDLDALDERTDDYLAKVEEGLAERPDVAELVRSLEHATEDDLPSGDELAQEIERFLRRGPDAT